MAYLNPKIETKRIARELLDEFLPTWEANYEPGNVSDYLIGYTNDEVAAKAAAIAWLQAQSDIDPVRLEWVEAPKRADSRYDRCFGLVQDSADGMALDLGINVRHRLPAGVRDAARQATGQPVCACSHPQDRHNSACAHCPCVGFAQTWPRQAAAPKPPVAYTDGKGRVYCLGCASTVGATVPLTVNVVDHWDVCPSCGRHVVDAARQASTQQPDAETTADCPDCDHPFLIDGCNPPRYLQPGDTVDMIGGYERGNGCPHHAPAVGQQDATQPTTDETEHLVHVGWWCWRGNDHGHLADMACRSDNVPIHVPTEWAAEMRAVIEHLTDNHEPGEDCTWVTPEEQAAETQAAAVHAAADRVALELTPTGTAALGYRHAIADVVRLLRRIADEETAR